MGDIVRDGDIEAQIKTIARRIREEREKLRISQMDLSFRAGLSQNQVFCIETGKRVPNLYTVLKLCEALGISPAALFAPADEEKARARENVIKLVSKYM
ncbi:MAG: helix-turn-helix domain-containing protein [Spirochaetaceae bacterium]|jgi:transcriptional regulator with XRE-family HTH domain|nr:helix-turn-helix domain-containing protein [Spirochaetaceae bacterium]